MGKLIDRIGEVNKNKFGTTMEIIEYKNADNILVKFEQGYITKTTYADFRKGKVKNVLDRTICGIGFLGQGRHATVINGERTTQYITWKSMLIRCYSNKFLERNPTYEGCVVEKEWHNFQNFAEWYDENFYEIDGEKISLDKDILKKNNKIYSPKFCIFTPKSINNLFTKSNSRRGKLPIGVHFSKNSNRYIAACNDGNKNRKPLGYYSSPEDAFKVYKRSKENLIKEIAEKYKVKIPAKLYDALKTYEVEIDD